MGAWPFKFPLRQDQHRRDLENAALPGASRANPCCALNERLAVAYSNERYSCSSFCVKFCLKFKIKFKIKIRFKIKFKIKIKLDIYSVIAIASKSSGIFPCMHAWLRGSSNSLVEASRLRVLGELRSPGPRSTRWRGCVWPSLLAPSESNNAAIVTELPRFPLWIQAMTMSFCLKEGVCVCMYKCMNVCMYACMFV